MKREVPEAVITLIDRTKNLAADAGFLVKRPVKAGRKRQRSHERICERAKTAQAQGVALSEPRPAAPSFLWRKIGIAFGALALAAGVIATMWPADTPLASSAPAKTRDMSVTNNAPSLETLLAMTDEEMAGLGLAQVNLLCSEGLPGCGSTASARCLQMLDGITSRVWEETNRHFHRYTSAPSDFENSEACYRIVVMNSVIAEDFGLRYNPQKIAAPSVETLQDRSFFQSADDIFLSGLLGSHRMGTCSSMPVLCVAVGRRLGYPLKLATAKAHLFFRWEDAAEKRNFECTNGIVCHPDSHYRQWPFPITDAEAQQGHYLHSLTPRQELAVFLSLRGQVLLANGKIEKAIAAHKQASELHPGHPDYEAGLAVAMARQTASERNISALSSDPFAEIRDIQAHNARNARLPGHPMAFPAMPFSDPMLGPPITGPGVSLHAPNFHHPH